MCVSVLMLWIKSSLLFVLVCVLLCAHVVDREREVGVCVSVCCCVGMCVCAHVVDNLLSKNLIYIMSLPLIHSIRPNYHTHTHSHTHINLNRKKTQVLI